MSLREVDRLKVIQAVIEGFLTPTRAAQRLQLSTRQVHRLVQRYRDAGVSGLTSCKRGQSSNHQLRPGLSSAPPL
ncbi:helix-turn-helix domain-containing protein [Pseudomonas sp. BAV 2493]|nr:helix-turn-helix domain-containing protein [Pseudomonas sp. BAV 2493]